MNLQTLVADVKSRAQQLNARGQKVAKVSLDSLKQANQIVVDRSHTLLDTQAATSRSLLESARAGFTKARNDGVKAVLAAPTSYLPARDKFTTLLTDTRSALTQTRDELVKVAKNGYSAATHEDVATKVKKAASKVTRTAKKSAGKATKAAKAAVAEVKA
ncbi:MAG: hypothetical protein EPN72_05575 [Nevskiaceae bacterium]|nr:MAG: hypothetical protein EPN63_03620 [Nevskiaceae bacterium]TBR73605.1 MAG: hypothetical protein EPN72_05575 [Nevskiaceae bacterium]